MDKLSGHRALVVEDEAGIALMIEDMLQDLGCEIVASVARLNRACEMARTVTVDFAIVDLNLDGQLAYPVARMLRERKIPVIFSTGYGVTAVPPEFDGTRLLTKPFVIHELHREISAALLLST